MVHAHQAAAILLRTVSAEGPLAREALAEQLCDVEETATAAFMATLEALHHVPGHPRAASLHRLAVDLEDVVDQCCACAARTTQPDMHQVPRGAREMVVALGRAVDHLDLSWGARRAGAPSRALWHGRGVAKLARDARDLSVSLLADLLETHPTEKVLRAHRELLDGLKHAVDLCESAALSMHAEP
jgi:hypothetical protein